MIKGTFSQQLVSDGLLTWNQSPAENIHVTSCSCDSRSWNTVLFTVQCAIRSASLMVILAIFLLPWQHFSALACLLIMKKHKKTKGKCQTVKSSDWMLTVATDWPTSIPDCLKAQLGAFEVLHISPILVSLFSAIYSQRKVCRSIYGPIFHCHPTLIKPVTRCGTQIQF